MDYQKCKIEKEEDEQQNLAQKINFSENVQRKR